MAMQQDACTKARLLAAAREQFALRGVQEATVRDICAQAGANVAAVNYHFGGKDKLYVAVLEDFIERAQVKYPAGMDTTPDSPPQERLRAYIRSLLYRLAGDGDPLYERLGILLTKEFLEPSEHFLGVMDRYLSPQHEVLIGVLRELMPGADERSVHLCAAGVAGHCLLFDNAKQVIRRMSPEMALENLGVETVADFVYRYALAGIGQMRGPRP
jgi:AcrR family transcriptional regulator